MIQRKEGLINKIVYDNTVFHDGEFHFYPSVPDLYRLLRLILESNVTTKSLRITPFYRNGKLQRQIEFDNMMLYIECASHVTKSQQSKFIQDSIIEDEVELNVDIEKRIYLCDEKNVTDFQNFIRNYADYISCQIPNITEQILRECNISVYDILCGYICFEIYSE